MQPIVIKTPEQFDKIMEERRDKAEKRIVNEELINNTVPQFDYLPMVNQTVKVIQYLPIEPTIKKIMTKRLLHVANTRKEVSHLQIALELGLTEDEVIEMEAFGVQALEEFLTKNSGSDAIQKFNRDKTVEEAVAKEQLEMGKSE